ncbi:MAG: PorP/SprF family type IX secretion system membrane protein [Bacteroidota bacterium]
MRSRLHIYLSILFLFTFTALQAQDPVFSQFFTTPMQLNPAFAGNTLAPRISINYRTQWLWPAPTNVYRTYSASYGQFFEPLNSSIGLMVEADNAGEGIYKTNRVSAFYGYRLKINDGLFIKSGIDIGFVQSTLNWNQLTFLDQIDPIEGIVSPSDEVPIENLTRSYGTVGAGLLAYGKNFYAGFGAKHLNTPNEALTVISDNLNSGLPMRFSAQAGGQFTFQKGNKKNAASFISPNVTYIQQGDFAQLNGGAYLGYRSFFGGIWYRHAFSNSDAAIFLVGAEVDIFRIGYSYDFTVSGLAASSGGTGGASEITIVLNFENSAEFKRRRRSNRYNDCLKIFR